MKSIIRNFHSSDYVPIQLHDTFLKQQEVDATNHDRLKKEIQRQVDQQNGKIGYGGWLEKRSLYAKDPLFNQQQKRNIHLGYDFWCEAGEAVIAPLDGKILSVKNNAQKGDYGPTIILEHHLGHQKIYTLYGHLSLESLSIYQKGDKIKADDVVGFIGELQVNGNYVPHLHFQLMSSMLKYQRDFPGVAAESHLPYYLQVVHHPDVILKWMI